MTVYYGKLQLEGDTQVLPAVVRVEMGVLSLSSGQTELGEWKLYQISMSELDQWIVLGVDNEKVYLDLTERARFMDETKTYRKDDSKKRRRREKEHPAFVKNDPAPPAPEPVEQKPAVTERLKGDVIEEAAPLIDEARKLLDLLPRGWPLWVGVAAVVVAAVFVPLLAGILFGLFMGVGILAVLAGGIGYVEPGFGVRYPHPFTPTRLMLGGGALLILAIPFAILS